MNRVLAHPSFEAIDRQLALFLERRCGGAQPELALAAALLSRAQRQGHVCLDLRTVAGRRVNGLPGDEPLECVAPALAEWRTRLAALPVVGRPGELTPLVLDDHGRLYLHRFWDYEQRLADHWLRRATAGVPAGDAKRLRLGIERHFGPPAPGAVNWQKVAACAIIESPLVILSGGPGTGKTRTAVAVLALLLEENPGWRVVLAAPTGKAAARLKETLDRTRSELACGEEIRSRLPAEAVTIHRLLGALPDSPRFRWDANRPLELDLLVVDEASMVDLALMAKLVDALPDPARLILVGDPDQLAPVEAGHVFGDLCRAAAPNVFSAGFRQRCAEMTGECLPPDPEAATKPAPNAPLTDRFIRLERNYRFGERSGIGQLSRAIRLGDAVRAGEALSAAAAKAGVAGADLVWRELPPPRELSKALRALVLEGWGDLGNIRDPAEALARFHQFRVLCAVRQGPYGVEEMNRQAEAILAEAGRIQPHRLFYEGRPILVTRNDYAAGVFNGDVGLLRSGADGGLHAVFQVADGSLRRLPLARLPEHETAYAMTVHKSQGSEFDRVLLVLPDRDGPLLTRELFYTAVTRARERVEVWVRREMVGRIVGRQIQRGSGLTDAMRR